MAIVPQKFDRKRTSFSEVKAPVTTFFLNTVAGSGFTASATFVDYPGPIQKIFTKRETATAIFVSGTVGAFKNTNAGLASFGLLINGVDYLIAQFFFNDLNTHRAIPFTIPIASGLIAGTYIARLRWRTAATSVNADPNDVIHIRFDEGYFQ